MNFQSYESIANQIQHPKFSKADFLRHKINKDCLIQRLVSAKFHEEAFYGRFPNGFTTDLSCVVPDSPINLKIGDLVAYTNEYGVTFLNKKVLGFTFSAESGRVVYLDSDCYWMAAPLSSLTLQDGLIGVDEADLLIVEEKYKNSSIPFDVQQVRAKKDS
ncbi:hypothetical protein IRT38_01180 (plasmid) [Acinetobacter sp. SK-43]|uniref:hypothetical protein n=1 Tax=Acinetobacter sp. SK-43 TaxID=2785295 RepID=UPI00188D5D03|nr:hypothetical protein [Acinetobacter sp. SK-43]MBF4454029.1 hypothetical protein [Acinetobacter sp. SK-43]